MHVRIASTVAGLGAMAVASAAEGIQEQRSTFQSGGHAIGIESFFPTTPGKKPALLVIHGAGGVDYGNGYIRQLAAAFAANGMSTHLIHYFDRTDTHYADDATIHRNFETWLSVIRDAVDHVEALPTSEPGAVGLFGYSLGGYLAVAQGSRNPKVGAVVELAGGIDPTYAARTERMPPTLILHGEQDRRVLPARARELEILMGKLSTPCEVKIYRGEGHVLSPMAALDALTRGVTFLNRHLATPKV